MSAEQVLEYSANHEWELFPVNVDGYFFPKSPDLVFAAGEQSKVPLMVGWNSEEGHYSNIFGDKDPNEADYKAALQKSFGDKSGEFWKYYGGTTVEAMKQGATDLSSDNFIGYGTWKWADMQSQTSGKLVYRYFYTHPRPPIKGEKQPGPAATGASHSAEIEYAMGNLSTNKFFDWKAEDYAVSEIIQGFFVNFIKTGNPNGLGLPDWPTVKPGVPAEVMIIDVDSRAETEQHRDRYLFRDKLY
jgi:para-nitrobenzyl esterase